MSRAILTCVALTVALAAGCGGDDESSSEAWTNDFCSAAADWRTSIDDIVGQFQSPSDLNADSLESAVDDGLEATESFLDEVDSLGAPETEGGQEVAGIVDSMKSDVQSTAADLRATAEGSGDLLSKVTQMATQASQLQQELQSSLDELENVQTGELGSELESNEDCAAARSGSSE